MGIPEALEALERVPHALPLQPVPESVQLNPLFCGSFWTTAVNVCVCCSCTVEVLGETLMPTGATTLIPAAEDLLGSAIEVAIRLTAGDDGACEGAV